MGNILVEKFKNISFTRAQQKIAQYMIDNEYEIPHMSLMDVSRAVGVSDASVLRLVRQIGYPGYNEFKKELYEKLVEQAGAPVALVHKLTERMPASGAEGLPSMAVAREQALRIVSDSFQMNPASAYEEILDKIKKSRRIFVYGRRGTREAASHFSYTMWHLLDNITFLEHYEAVYPALSSAGYEDLLIFFCLSRFYETDLHILQAAKSRSLPVCLITDQIPSIVSGYADFILRVRAASLSYFNSSLGTSAVSEYLLARLSNDMQSSTLQARLDYIDEFTESERCH